MTPLRRRRVLIAVLLSSGMFLASCSGGDEQAAPATETIDLRESGAAVDTGQGDAEPVSPVSEGPIEIVTEPALRLDEDPSIDTSNWIARTFMDSSSVELVWSPVENADTYRLFRLLTESADYDAISDGIVDGAEEIYVGPEFGFIDDDVPTGTFLTYVIVADVGDARTEPRWTEALTVDDVTPPVPISALVASETNDGVLLEWDPSPDDVEFAAYNVSILEDGQFRYIGGGADVGQVSFLDDEDFAGTRTYVVAAVDFHNNVSETAQVDVTR